MTLSQLIRTFWAALLLGAGMLWAGEFQGRLLFKTYGPEQGLMEPALVNLAQDSDGFIWIATEYGLVRYDGAGFRKWTVRDGLPSSFVQRVLAAPQGGLWVATNKGLARLRGGRIEPVLVDGRSFAAPASQVGQDTQGRLWVLREDGLYRQQGDLDFQRVPGRPPGRSRALACRGAGGDVFVAVGDGLWERREDGSWVDWSDRGLAQDGIEALAVDKGGRLWVVGGRSLLCLDPGAASFRDLSSWLPAPPFTGCVIEPGGDGSVSIPTNAGLLRIHGSSREVIDDSLGLPCKWTASSLVDREGNLWVLGPRLYRLLGRGYVRSYTAQDGLPNDLVWTALRDPRGTLWAGTSNGLARLGPKGWKAIAGTEGLSVTCLVMDGKGRLWVGANNASLRVLDPGAGRAAPFPLHGLAWNGPAAAFPSRSASLMLDREGALWLGDPGQGIYRLDLERRTIRLEYGPREAGLDDFAVRRFHLDAQGRLWAASNAGLILRDQAGWHQFTKAQGLSETSLQGLAPGGDGSCWVLYHEPVGLTRVAVTGGRLQVLQQLDTAHGLASDRVYSVGVDPKGAVWVGIDRGVERFRGGQGFHISQGGGMPGEDCSGNGIFAEPDGTVWVGTSTGLARILPGQEPPAPGPLRVILTQVLRGKGRLGASLQSLPRLSHRDATLEFRFASPTFVNEKAVIYQVRLLGLEDEWRTTDVPQVRYTALPGGRYRFEVRAAYPGQPFGPPTVYPLEVLPPWWRTWWALGLGLLGTGGAVYGLVQWRVRTLARQKRRLATLVQRRTEALVKANQALEKANLALKSQSLTDPLTGLHNRRFLSVVVDEDVAKVQRAYRDAPDREPLPNQDLVYFIVDLDLFKQINDRHGHAAGDRVLEATATALRRAARETDAVIRWGGEEFLLMARHSSRREAHLLAERIRTCMAEQSVTLESGEVLRWTCSVGFAAYPFQLNDLEWMGWERVVEIADACLYLAKKGGRDGWVGAQARPGLQRAVHGPRLPWELQDLMELGVLELHSNRRESVERPPRVGQVFG